METSFFFQKHLTMRFNDQIQGYNQHLWGDGIYDVSHGETNWIDHSLSKAWLLSVLLLDGMFRKEPVQMRNEIYTYVDLYKGFNLGFHLEF